MPSLAATAEGCDDPRLSLQAKEECNRIVFDINKQCRAKLGLPEVSAPSPEPLYIKLAECDEAAAGKIKNKAAAETLMSLVRDLRRVAKPGAVLGMTDTQVIEEAALGKPLRVSRSVTAAGVREQWVYPGSLYLYFENGILVSFQSSR
jgi:hypothetical protein